MIETGSWAKGDDKRLINALAAAGAQEEFQLDWGSLVPSRSAEQVGDFLLWGGGGGVGLRGFAQRVFSVAQCTPSPLSVKV